MSGTGFSEKDLLDKGYTKNPNGSYDPPKKTRGVELLFNPMTADIAALKSNGYKIAKGVIKTPTQLRRLSLCLFGEPMPKQSVRSYVKNEKIMHFQPAKMGQRVKDYQRQIREQLPADFKMFSEIVHVRKLHFVFCPLKSFSRNKMDRIAAGEIFFKATKPDLPDNLKKLVNDSMSGLVYKDDSLIVSEDNVKKYYGTGGMILLELEGY